MNQSPPIARPIGKINQHFTCPSLKTTSTKNTRSRLNCACLKEPSSEENFIRNLGFRAELNALEHLPPTTNSTSLGRLLNIMPKVPPSLLELSFTAHCVAGHVVLSHEHVEVWLSPSSRTKTVKLKLTKRTRGTYTYHGTLYYTFPRKHGP